MLRRVVLLTVRAAQLAAFSVFLGLLYYAIMRRSAVLGMFACVACTIGLVLELYGVFLFESPRLKQGFKRQGAFMSDRKPWHVRVFDGINRVVITLIATCVAIVVAVTVASAYMFEFVLVLILAALIAVLMIRRHHQRNNHP